MKVSIECVNRLTSHDDNFYKAFFKGVKTSGEVDKALQSGRRNCERLHDVIFKPGMFFSKVICNH